MAASHELGRRAERAVVDYLRQHGWSILATNWRFRHREIDVVAAGGDVLVFIEVKCRSGNRFGSPGEAVTAAKRRDLAIAARAWIARYGAADRACRFDVCSVAAGPGGTLVIEHIEDAWRA